MVSFPRRRRPPPTVSATPPPARRVPIVGGSRPPPPTIVRGGESFEKGRVVALFGGLRTGKSALLRIIADAAQTPVAVVDGFLVGNEEEKEIILERIEELRANGTEVIFLDGCPRNAEEAQWLYDERLVAPAFGGVVVRVDRNAAPDLRFANRLGAIEERLVALSMPYFVLKNDDLERSAVQLLCRSGVVK